MKKISLYISLAVVMALLTAGNSFAQVLYNRGADSRIKTEVVSGTVAQTLSSNITTNNRIIGYTYTDSAAGNVALFDASVAIGGPTETNDPSTANVFSEGDVIAGGNIQVIFPLPKNLTSGLVTKNSATTGKLVIYYE